MCAVTTVTEGEGEGGVGVGVGLTEGEGSGLCPWPPSPLIPCGLEGAGVGRQVSSYPSGRTHVVGGRALVGEPRTPSQPPG